MPMKILFLMNIKINYYDIVLLNLNRFDKSLRKYFHNYNHRYTIKIEI